MNPVEPDLPPGPPKIIEAVVGRLIPAERRDDVLGDLYERYTSSSAYVWNALRLVPFMVFIHIRRNLDCRMLVVQAAALLCSFQFAMEIADFVGSVTTPRTAMILPVVAALAVLVLCRAYTSTGPRPRLWSASDAVIAFAGAFAVHFAAMWASPAQALPLPVFAMAAGFGVILLTWVEEARQGAEKKAGLNRLRPIPSIGWRAHQLQQQVRRFSRRERWGRFALAIFVVGALAIGVEVLPRTGWSLWILVLLYMTWLGPVRNVPRAAPSGISWEPYRAYYRLQLEAQRDVLRSISSRILLPLGMGFVFLLVASTVHYGVFGSPFTFAQLNMGVVLAAGIGLMLGVATIHTRKLSRLAALRLDREMKTLDRLEKRLGQPAQDSSHG